MKKNSFFKKNKNSKAKSETSFQKDKWKVLIVDDDLEVHHITRLVLDNLTFDGKSIELISTYSARETEQLMQETSNIALILLDVVMERTDSGLNVVRFIREKLNNKYVRIVLRTGQPGNAPENSIIIDYDINGYTEKTELSSNKLKSAVISSLRSYQDIINLANMRNHLEDLVDQRNTELKAVVSELTVLNQSLQKEQNFAKEIFTKIINTNDIESANIHYAISPQAILKGDILLFQQSISGAQYILFGNFSTHGLSSAVAALPVSLTFNRLIHSGYALDDIIEAINDEIRLLFSSNLSLFAAVLEINTKKDTVSIWNGGLPDIFYKRQDKPVKRIKSQNPPLGTGESFDCIQEIEIFEVTVGDSFFTYSDNLLQSGYLSEQSINAINSELSSEQASEQQNCFFDYLMQQLKSSSLTSEQIEGLAMLEMVYQKKPISKDSPHVFSHRKSLLQWKTVINFNASLLHSTDPIPVIMHLIIDNPEFESHKANIYTIVAELVNNAVEHGLLDLQSSLKNEEDGFSRYYLAKHQKLASISVQM